MPFSKQKDFYEDFYGRSSWWYKVREQRTTSSLYRECDTYVQSWLKLTKKTRFWGSLLWFARFISPDILYFNPCVNTSTLCTRFCINRTDSPRKNTLSTSFLISFYIFFFFLYFYCLFICFFSFLHVWLIQIHARARLHKIREQMSNLMSMIPTRLYSA